MRAPMVWFLFLAGAAASFPGPAGAQTPDLSSAMHWREIGPTRAGRARALAGVPSQPNVFYAGFDNGGVWRSTDYGANWEPIFDRESTGSIGAIAVAPSDPNVIYVGSGAGIIRPDLAIGDGMYKSTDAGRTWTHLGLRESQMIAMVDVDPKDPNRLFVAALGHPYGPNAERGIFRSVDGGKSFQKVLYKDEYTSGSDVRIDPSDPNIVYAALWQQQEQFVEGRSFSGPNGGIFKSSDGGTTWKPLTDGLPAVGQANLAIAPSNPRTIYATVAPAPPPAGAAGAGRGGRGGGGGGRRRYRTVQVDRRRGTLVSRESQSERSGRAPRRPRPTPGHWRALAAATCRPLPSIRRMKTSSTPPRPSRGAPMMGERPGRRFGAPLAAMTIRRSGSTRTTTTSSSSWRIRARSFPPIMANPGAAGTRSPRPPCIMCQPTTAFPILCAAASRTLVLPVSQAARWTARSRSTTGIR